MSDKEKPKELDFFNCPNCLQELRSKLYVDLDISDSIHDSPAVKLHIGSVVEYTDTKSKGFPKVTISYNDYDYEE